MKTEIIRINNGDQTEVFMKAGKLLKEGKTVAFPTDTVYGLGAVYNDREAVRRVFKAKGRPENKPLCILISDISQVCLLAADVPEAAEKLMERFWPGALTLIFKKNISAGIPDEVTAGKDTIGIRMPGDRAALGIIRAAGCPLAVPSANRSGARSAASAQDVIDDLDGRIDMIIDRGDCPIGVSSTILDVSSEDIKILREGTISTADIEKYTGIKVSV